MNLAASLFGFDSGSSTYTLQIPDTGLDFYNDEVFKGNESAGGLRDQASLIDAIHQLLNSSTNQIRYFFLGHQEFIGSITLAKLLLMRWHAEIKDNETDASVLANIVECLHCWICFCLPADEPSLALRHVLGCVMDTIDKDIKDNCYLTDQHGELKQIRHRLKKRPLVPCNQWIITKDFAEENRSEIGMVTNGKKKDSDFLELLSVDARLLATHLSIASEELLLSTPWSSLIKVKEWKSLQPADHYYRTADPISRLISRMNGLSQWVMSSILRCSKPKKRAEMIEHVYRLAMVLRDMRNYDSLVPILLCLQHPVITRLKKTWKYVSERVKKDLGMIEQNSNTATVIRLCSPMNNWAYLREEQLRSMKELTPSLHYFGLVMSDLILNEEAKSDTIPASSSDMCNEFEVNLNKHMTRARIVYQSYVRGCQGQDLDGEALRLRYRDTAKHPVNEKLLQHMFNLSTYNRPSDQHLWDLSKSIE